MTVGFRERERILRDLRDDHRPADEQRLHPPRRRRAGPPARRRSTWSARSSRSCAAACSELELLLNENPLLKGRTVGVGYLDLTGCMALGITGPVLRVDRPAARPAQVRALLRLRDLRLRRRHPRPAATPTAACASASTRCTSRCKIVEQASTGCSAPRASPVMVEDKKIAWPAQLAIGGDGMGNSLDHIREIMGTSMESPDPPLQAGHRGLPGPAGPGLRRGRVAPRASSAATSSPTAAPAPTGRTSATRRFNNLQAVAAMCEGGQVADVIVAVASIDPVMGGVDR